MTTPHSTFEGQGAPSKGDPSVALYGLVGLLLVVEYVVLGLACDFQPMRGFAAVARLGRLVNDGVTISIVAIAALLLFLVRKRGVFVLQGIGERLSAARRRILVHAGCYALQFAVSLVWFHIGAPASVPVGVAILWLVTAALTGVSALAVAYVPSSRLPLRTVLLVVMGALGIGALTLGVARLANVFWPPLQEGTLTVVAMLASLAYPDLWVDTSTAVLATSNFAVSVEPMCSGVEGMGLMAVLMPTFIWLNRETFRVPRAYWLVLIGVAGMWVLNCVRIFLLVVLGSEVSPKLAMGAFHSRAGWLFFSMLTIVLAAYAIRSPFWSARAAERSERSTLEDAPHNPVTPYMLPLVALIGTSMVTSAFAEGVDRFYGLRALPVLAVVWFYRATYLELLRGFAVVPAVSAGLGAFAVWWGLSEPSWLPGWTALSGRTDPAGALAEAQELAKELSPFWIAIRAVVSASIIPFAEELAFRGYLLRRLSRREFETLPFTHVAPFAIVISSLAFGILHDAWLAGFAAGAIFAWVQIKTGSLANAVVAHAVANAAVAVYVLTAGAWNQWL